MARLEFNLGNNELLRLQLAGKEISFYKWAADEFDLGENSGELLVRYKKYQFLVSRSEKTFNLAFFIDRSVGFDLYIKGKR